MSILKPIDHQNIVLRLLARTAASDAQHLTALAHAHKLPVSLHQARVACDALVEQQFVARTITGYRLTTHGECELPAVPLLESYYIAPAGGVLHDAPSLPAAQMPRVPVPEAAQRVPRPRHV